MPGIHSNKCILFISNVSEPSEQVYSRSGRCQELYQGRAQLFGAGDGLRNRHCSPWISACFLSLLDFSCALVLSWYRLLGVSELKATVTRPGFTHSILDGGARQKSSFCL